MFSFWKLHKYPILLGLASVMFYAVFAYDLEREDFVKLLTLFVALFFFQFKLIQFEKWNFNFLLVAGVLFRIVFLFTEPNLSQDFYRFIWDGEIINNGINPYLYTPNQIMEGGAVHISNASTLHEGMGSLSARHYSNYPPLNQIIFTLSTYLGGRTILGALVAMRLFIIGADIGILLIGKRLLLHLGKPPHLIFWYFINPLVIIELTGNLHFEGVMLFFFIWSMYFISKDKLSMAAPVYALSILLKLVPILFLPLFLRHFKLKKSIVFYALIGLTCFVFLIPFYSEEFIANYSKTVGLWFSNFEFNASIYNIVKVIGVTYFDEKPWLLVKAYGSLVPKIIIVVALLLTFVRGNGKMAMLFGSMLALLSCYYFLSSTVHPWYVIFLVLLSIFTKYRFALLWSAAVVLSYYAYSNPDFKESLWLITVEYLVVFGYLGYEIFKNHNIIPRFRKKFNFN